MSATLPAWAERMRELFRSGAVAQFILHGNVFDVVSYSGAGTGTGAEAGAGTATATATATARRRVNPPPSGAGDSWSPDWRCSP